MLALNYWENEQFRILLKVHILITLCQLRYELAAILKNWKQTEILGHGNRLIVINQTQVKKVRTYQVGSIYGSWILPNES